MTKKRWGKNIFHSAEDELKSSVQAPKTPQTESPSYRLAFTDTDFLLRRSLRSVRLQLELLKPELLQQDYGIHSTIAVFGSARIPEPDVANSQLEEARLAVKATPKEAKAQLALKKAEAMVHMSQYYQQARDFSRLVAQSEEAQEPGNAIVVTGGGPGIMEAANRGADDGGAQTVGLAIVLPQEEAPNAYVTPELSFRFHYFSIRKMHFFIRARAFVAFPGGYGTMDELFEALTLVQTHKTERLPIILVGKDFWSRLINFPLLVEYGLISPEDIDLFQYVETAQEAWDAISSFYVKQETS